MSRASVVPLLIVVALYGALGPSASFAGVLALLALLPLLVRARIPVTVTLQVVFACFVIPASVALLAAFLPRDAEALVQLPTGWAALAGAFLLASVALRFAAAPANAELGHLTLQLVALMACGGADGGWRYVSGVAAFVVAALFVRRQASRSRAPLNALFGRHFGALCLMAFVSVGLASALVRALPEGHAWALGRLQAIRPPAVGFADRLWLGSLRGLLDSPQQVLRVTGDVELLRGAVLNRYEGGHWSRHEGPLDVLRTPHVLAGSDVVELEWVDGDPKRYFVPLDSEEVAFSSGAARMDAFGALVPLETQSGTRVQVRRGAGRALGLGVPSAEDLRIPPAIESVVAAQARSYSEGALTDSQRLAALIRGLQRDHAYSLDFEPSQAMDPVLQFLRSGQGGHCEYFAAALALLARSVGIPARVVVGYRVVERNPISGYGIVRERDAHAWVEAWVGAWRTFDPTPAGGSELEAARTTPLGAAVLDALSAWASRALERLDRLSVGEALSLPAVLVLLVAGFYWRRQRGARLALNRAQVSQPLPSFLRLSRTLVARGIKVTPDDSLETLAGRVAASSALSAHAAECTEALRSYAALRYGDLGDASAIEARLDRLSRALRTRLR